MQPFVAARGLASAAPVRMVYSRTESDDVHHQAPSLADSRAGGRGPRRPAHRHGFFRGFQHRRLFVVGTHRGGARADTRFRDPIAFRNYRAQTRAVHTHLVPAGAFRGFGVPQAAIAQEQLFDELANLVGMDRLEFRILNALDASTAHRHRPGSGRWRRDSRVL